MQCPICKGTGVLHGCQKVHICYQCNGKCDVPDEMMQWIDDGNKYRIARQRKNETIGNAAKRLGVGVLTLLDIEIGKNPIPKNLRIEF